ncbi:MAG TPA: anthranilate synthase component I family protein, partial [Phycisphaerales bacterium]|nr:anthranilate synthase component I family protein [Phycisphaerales bacterium]
AAILARINDGWVFDNRTGRWSSFGSPAPLANPKDPGPAGFQIGEVFGLEREQAYIRAVRRAVELIHAGDAFQVNLTHRLWASFKGSPRSLFAELSRRLRPWHAVYLECPARSSQPGPTAIASFSPELFLELTPGGQVTTRPMKGTRPGDALVSEFLDAEKDRAELAMIVDLMRNDLGRVCTFGSVDVDSPRQIEHHGKSITGKPELVQGVATISGQLRPGESVESLLRATFPPGSITGAPKIRAMQIIDTIEHALGYDKALPDRGPYCGSCGYIGDTGSALLNVAIRTAIISNNRIDYPVGAGIVADSDPQSEWNETLDKAKPFLDLAAHHRREAHLCRETRPGAR